MTIQKKTRRIALAIAPLLITAVVSAENNQEFARAQRENAQKLRQYTWKSRTEIQKGGETKAVQLSLMRYDANGKLQVTPLSGTSQETPQRGLRGRIARKKKEGVQETVEELKAIAASYAELPPDEMQRLAANTVMVPEVGKQSGQIRATSTGIRQQGDAMTVWMDAATGKMRRIEIFSMLDKKTVRVVSEFKDLPDGPTYMARSVMTYPSEELTVITENFDYERGNP